MKTDMGVTGPGKAEVYTMAYVYCYIFFLHFSHMPHTPWGGRGGVNFMRAGNFVFS